MFSFKADERHNCLHFQGQVWAKTINTVTAAGGTKQFICKQSTEEADRSRINLNNNYWKQRSLFSFLSCILHFCRTSVFPVTCNWSVRPVRVESFEPYLYSVFVFKMIMCNWFDTDCKTEWAIFTQLISLTGPLKTSKLVHINHSNQVQIVKNGKDQRLYTI